jgi:hypothetical protein
VFSLQAVIGLTTLYIAYQQMENSRYKNKMDLFEKRFDVYLRLGRALSLTIQGNKNLIGIEFINECEQIRRISKLLFKDEISKEVDEIISKIQEQLIRYQDYENLNFLSEDERLKLGSSHAESLAYFDAKIKKLEEIFSSQLKLEN